MKAGGSMDCGRERDEVSLKILDTANTLFDQCGVEQVSMHQIAKTAGVGQGTLYRRYSNKSRLCYAVMKNKFDIFMEEAEAALQQAAGESVKSRLSLLITMIVSLTQKDMACFKTVIDAGKLEDAKENLFEAPPFVFVVDKIQGLLEEALSKGDISEVDPKFAARMIAFSFPPVLILHLYDLGYTSSEIVEQYRRTFIDPLFTS